jgi:hypothetical protein
MTSKVTESLIEELEAKLGDSFFITLRQLVDCGFYGSVNSARRAIENGHLPFVRISTRRLVIPRSILLEFLRTSLEERKR